MPETILMCGYFKEGVLKEMAVHAGIVDCEEGKGERGDVDDLHRLLQDILLSLLLSTIRLAGLTRFLIYQGDIYEEEDYSPMSVSGVDYCLGDEFVISGTDKNSSVFGDRKTEDVEPIMEQLNARVMKEIASSSSTDADLMVVQHVIDFNTRMYSLCKTLTIGTPEEKAYLDSVKTKGERLK